MTKNIISQTNYSLDEIIQLLQPSSRQLNASGTLYETVFQIIENIKKNKDKALIEYTKKFDYQEDKDLTINDLTITKEQSKLAYERLASPLQQALHNAYTRIYDFHQQIEINDFLYEDPMGVTLGFRWNPIQSIGLYVPGGKALYPSSVLMNAIPAKVAGVQKLTMTVPSSNGKIDDIILAAAYICGIDQIYLIGGAQAIASLAYGTESIESVDKIIGPGNQYVAEAKRQVFGKVGIDTIAGPSEVMIIAETQVNPQWVALDLLAQAEHDENAQSILITNSQAYAENILNAIHLELQSLPNPVIAKQSWEDNGRIVVLDHLIEDSPQIVNAIAPEHLEINVVSPKEYMNQIHNAGAIFIGAYTPEAIGDYIAGPSHVLPTSGAAKFSSGLSVHDFIKKSSIIECSQPAFQKIASDAILLADAEHLYAHKKSLSTRLQKTD